MVRPILHSSSSVLSLIPASAPGASISDLVPSVSMSVSSLRVKVRELVNSGAVVRVPPVEVGGTPRYHLAIASEVEV